LKLIIIKNNKFMSLLKIGVPTTTVIVYKKDQYNMVVVLRSTGKHGNKLILPGGKVRVGRDNWKQTGIDEVSQEVNINDLKNIQQFCVASNPDRDKRTIPLKWFLDGNDFPDGIPHDIQIETYHSFDMILLAESNTEPAPDGDEGSEAFYVDVNNVNPNDYALDHGHMLVAYAHYLKTGEKPALDQF
jgi:ADP-ribose pyrophosphatase YjhB (NUDIX family)